jgi:hypothetical protein
VDKYGCTCIRCLDVTICFSYKICWVGDAINANVRGSEGSNVSCLRNYEYLDGVIFTTLGFSFFKCLYFLVELIDIMLRFF